MAFALRDYDPSSLAEGRALSNAVRDARGRMAAGEVVAAWQALRPFVHAFVPFALAGPFWEMAAHCAFAGACVGGPAIDGQVALTRALHAYQEEHDVPGMARTHAALGHVGLARGELDHAARELGYAQQLSARSGVWAQRVGSLCRRAEVALMRMAPEEAHEWIEQAQAACRQGDVADAVEVQVRLVAGQAAALLGRPQEMARQLLWAERLAQRASALSVEAAGLVGSLGASLGTAASLGLMRAEALYRLGYPRRALSCLRQGLLPPLSEKILDGRDGPLEGRAHQLRLLGAALSTDEPRHALGVLAAAEDAFARLRQPYFRAFCQVAMAQAGARAAAPQAGALWERAASLPLRRWPLLQRHYDAARAHPGGPSVHIRGAVQVPWVVEVGQTRRRTRDAESPEDRAQSGLLGRLGGAMGRSRRAPAGD